MHPPPFMLPAPYGRLIDRQQPIEFRFDGRALLGYGGDTIASALARNGVRVISRSFKYHRPRGILSLNGLDANLLVRVNDEANVDAGTTRLQANMVVEAQNFAGSLTHDRKAALGWLGRFLPAGFYYRHFYTPKAAWPLFWEPFFRRQAGLGTVNLHEPRRHFRTSHAHYDVVVVGGGPAGMHAAVEAAQSGDRVLLVDRNDVLGGSLNYSNVGDALNRAVAEVAAHSNIDVWTRALCNGWFADHGLAILRDDKLIRVRARRTVFAAGSLEQLPTFRNNDLPGVMFSSTALRLIEFYGVRPGQRAVVWANDDRGAEVAQTLTAAGVVIDAVLQASQSVRVIEAIAGAGNRSIRGVRYADRNQKTHTATCDLLIIASAKEPADQLYRQAMHTVGPGRSDAAPICVGAIAAQPTSMAVDKLSSGGFVDLDEDITVADLQTALSAGYAEVELAKRFTTVGMGPSQGRHSARVASRWLAELTRSNAQAVGVTTARPPIYPERIGMLAGTPISRDKHSPLHDKTLAAGGRPMIAGGWLRPEYYDQGSGREAAVESEIQSVRQRVGLIDVSPLGKIELRGPDAAEFLDRLYTLSYASLAQGKTRYLLMTNDAGYIVDDGVTYRVSEDFFYVTATSSGVERTFRSMLKWRAIWKLNVSVTNVTNAFAAVNLAGPGARKVLSSLHSTIDLSPGAFPYLGGRKGSLDGVSALVMRIGFVGELGYEIHYPAEQADLLWDALLHAGAAEQIQPVGLQAMRALRLEKAHIIVGQDTDPLTWPDEVGMQWALSRKKPYFVGKHSIDFMRTRPLKRRLVPFVLPMDGALPRESDLIVDGRNAIGFITSITRSQTCSKIVGLGFAEGADLSAGRELQILSADRVLSARIVEGAFYDPDAKRQEG